MANINQQTILTYIEEVLPSMQSSSDPEAALLKYAHDKNMPPAVLERLGHMFNSYKINFSLDHAKTASERGNFVSTLDVPDLMEKYTDLAKDLDFNTVSKQASNNWWDNLEEGTLTKIASNTIKQGSVSDLFWTSKEDEELNIKVAKALNPEKPVQEENIDLSLVYKAYSDEAQNCLDLIQELTDEKNSIVSKYAKIYEGYTNTTCPAFDVMEHAAILNYEGRDVESFKDSLNKFANELSNCPNYVARNIKRASEDMFDQYVIADKPEQMDDLVWYHEISQDLKSALGLYKEASINAKAVHDVIFKKHAAIDSKTWEDIKRVLSPEQLKQLKSELKQQKRFKSLDDNLEDHQLNILNGIANVKSNLTSAKDKPINSSDESTFDIYSLNKGLFNAGKTVATLPIEFVKGTMTGTNALAEVLKNTQSDNSKEEAISDEIDTLKRDNVLSELMWTDPILSNLDENSIDTVLEAYNTVIRHTPDLAYDKGALRSILRNTVEAQGIDLNSVEALTNITKNKSQSNNEDK